MSAFRRIFTMLLVLALLSAVSFSAMAASFDVENSTQMQEAFGYSGGDSEVNINVTANVDMNGGYLTAQEGKTYNISSGNGSSLNELNLSGAGTVNIGTDVTGEDKTALFVYGDVTVSVTGDITSINGAVVARDNTVVTVTGDIDAGGHGVDAYDDSTVTVGSITAGHDGVNAYDGSNVTVTGDIEAGWDGVDAEDTGTVTVKGSITATEKGVYSEGSSAVTVTGDVDAGYNGVYAKGGTVNVNGSVTSDEYGVNAYGSSNVTVSGGIEAGKEDGVDAEDYSTVTVTGGIKAVQNGVKADDNSTVTVTGDIEAGRSGVFAHHNSAVTVSGDIEGGYYGVGAYDSSTVAVDGSVSGRDGDPDIVDYDNPRAGSDGADGVSASEKAAVTVTGDVRGGAGYGTGGDGGHALRAYHEASVTVGGSAIGGSVTAKPETKGAVSKGGNGVRMDNTATVEVAGSVLGGSTNGNRGNGGYGLLLDMLDMYEGAKPGSVNVGGQVSSGTGGEGGQTYSDLYFRLSSDDFKNVQLPAISVGAFDTLDGKNLTQDQLDAILAWIEDNGLSGSSAPDLFWYEVEQKLLAAEPGSEVTVDAGSRTSMPTSVLNTAAQRNVTLIIRWNGGDDIVVNKAVETEGYTIALAELAKLVK